MRFQCPLCSGIVAVDNSALGIKVQCGHCSGVIDVPQSRVAPGAIVADFIVQKELGRGGMGIVYLAHQISLDRPAALKVLSENYANDAQFVGNFIKEARAAAKLNHPHLVQAYAVGEDEGIFYFAMEDIDGKTMKEVLKEQQLLVLNLWYVGCSACVEEFPYMSSAYDKYNAMHGNGDGPLCIPNEVSQTEKDT